jgi:hypothetical protein
MKLESATGARSLHPFKSNFLCSTGIPVSEAPEPLSDVS